MASPRATLTMPKSSVYFSRGSRIGDYRIRRFYAEGSQSTLFLLEGSPQTMARVYFHGCEPDKTLSSLLHDTNDLSLCRILASGTTDGHYWEIVERLKAVAPLATLSIDVQIQLLHKEVRAVKSLHRLGYCHLDIKAEHFMQDSSGHVTLVDIGSAAKIGTSYTGEVSPFAPSELYAGRFSKESDYFSFGVAVLEQYFPQIFSGKSRAEIIAYIHSSQILDDCKKLPAQYRNIVASLLSDDPKARGQNAWFVPKATQPSALPSSGRAQASVVRRVPDAVVHTQPNISLDALHESIVSELLELAHKGEPALFQNRIRSAASHLNLFDKTAAQTFLNYLKTLPRAPRACNFTNANRNNILESLRKNVETGTSRLTARDPVSYMKFLCVLNRLYVINKDLVIQNDAKGADIAQISEKRAWSILRGIGIAIGVLAAVAVCIAVLLALLYVVLGIVIAAFVVFVVFEICSNL